MCIISSLHLMALDAAGVEWEGGKKRAKKHLLKCFVSLYYTIY